MIAPALEHHGVNALAGQLPGNQASRQPTTNNHDTALRENFHAVLVS
jgi:hypothetical protein